MSLGAFLGYAFAEPDAIASVQKVGNEIVPGFGTFAVLASVPALVSIMAVNMYDAMLTGIAAVDAYQPLNPTVRLRVIGIVIFGAIAVSVALAIPKSYLAVSTILWC